MKLLISDNCNESHFMRMSPRLSSIIFYVEYTCRKWKKESVWTSFIRPRLNDSGIHALGRGADQSVKNLDREEVEQLLAEINDRFPYGDGKHQSAIYHAGGGYGSTPPAFHIHYQVAE